MLVLPHLWSLKPRCRTEIRKVINQDVQGTEILPALPQRLKTVPWNTVNPMPINICKNGTEWILKTKHMSLTQVMILYIILLFMRKIMQDLLIYWNCKNPKLKKKSQTKLKEFHCSSSTRLHVNSQNADTVHLFTHIKPTALESQRGQEHSSKAT